MTQIIRRSWWWGGWANYTSWCWICIENNEISVDTSVIAEKSEIPTDNCQLANGCGYTTCTGTLVDSDLAPYAKCTDIPTDNCQLANWCGYTTCIGTVVASDLNAYQKTACLVCDLSGADNNHYPSAKAVADALSCAGAWDMLKSVYDPNNCNTDTFNYCNLYNKPTIPTNNNQLTNGCGYTTCTGTLVASDLTPYAKSCDIPTDNCQLSNWCWFATCTYVSDSINSVAAYYITKNAQGDQFATYAELAAATTFYSWWVARTPTRNDYTIVLSDENHDNATTRYIYNSGWEYQYTVNETAMTQAQLDALNSGITCAKVSCYDNCMAQCCDIPTNNNQLTNWCWYTTCTGTLVASDLTPYAKSCDLSAVATSWKYCDLSGRVTDNCQIWNSCWYITSSALNWYALSCDIPTDNCQLSNGCWYTTCTWTLCSCDLAPYAQTSCIACINWCCLTNGGNISVDGAFDSCPYTQAEYNQLEIDTPSVLTDGVWRLIYE